MRIVQRDRDEIGKGELHTAHLERLTDAEVLLAQKRWIGCVYMSGVAVECILKWAYCEKRSKTNYSKKDLWGRSGHDLDRLRSQARVEFVGKDAHKFELLKQWTVNYRYSTANDKDKEAADLAQKLNEAATAICIYVARSARGNAR